MTPARRVIMTGLVTSIAITVGVGFVHRVFEFKGIVASQLLGSAAMLVLMFAVATAAIAVMDRGRLRVPMTLAIATELVATMLVMYLIMDADRSAVMYEPLFQLAVVCALIGVGLTHNGVCSLVRTNSTLMLVTKAAAMAGVWLAALLWTGVVLFAPGYTNFGIAGIVTALAVLGTIILPVAAFGRADSGLAPVESIERRLRIELECPKCREMQEVSVGTQRCRNCRAWLTVDVEEPRCECGYLLYQLSGDYCPECGALIAPELRWSTG